MNRCKVQSKTCTKYHAKDYCHRHYKQVETHGRVLTDEEVKSHFAKAKGVRTNTGRTHFKKGQTSWNKGTKGLMPSPVAGFVKGFTPWNKGKKVEAMAGGNNPNWGGGVSSERHKAMTSAKYKEWRNAVFTRDNYTCQFCEQYSGTLHADHIEKWADNVELRYAVDNGRTLCVPCHYYITFKRKMKPGTSWCNFMAKKEG